MARMKRETAMSWRLTFLPMFLANGPLHQIVESPAWMPAKIWKTFARRSITSYSFFENATDTASKSLFNPSPGRSHYDFPDELPVGYLKLPASVKLCGKIRDRLPVNFFLQGGQAGEVRHMIDYKSHARSL
jgi:hypothetical protein